MHCQFLLGVALAAVSLVSVAAQTAPLSQRVVAYSIEARLDPDKKTLDAAETLRYRNLTGRFLDTFPFHLYLNAFQPKSTFVQELHRDNPRYKWDPKNYGAIEVRSISVEGMGDLTGKIQFLYPDDDNADDRTVMQVKLPRPVEPNEEVVFHISFHAQFPQVMARSGYRRDFFMGGQWFPKVGVWWKGGWNCHQYHSMTEFFADFGTYDVKLTLPRQYVVGASGVEVASKNNPDGTRTVTFHGQDIHDFGWAASPHFRVIEDSFIGSAGTVKIRALISPGHESQTGRYIYALKETMKRFDEWYGPYPYPQITLVDPPHGAFRASGMEYPMLFTGGTTWYMPRGVRLPEMVAVHEFGHQYWYGMVATNEFEDAWLDEGINSYTEIKVMDSIYGKTTSALSFGGATLSEDAMQRAGYLNDSNTDPLTRPGWLFMSRKAYNGVSYSKGATMLLTLEKIIGEDTLRRALRTYFARYRFTHPTHEDFLKTMEEVSGQDLRWYFDQAVYGTAVLDYEILRARSSRLDWTEKNPPKARMGETPYRTEVLVHRKGDFVFPVEVLVQFDNGQRVREHWDGRDRWIRYTYGKKAKIVSAELDPEYGVWLDCQSFNNSRLAEANRAPRRKVMNYWTLLVQFVASLLAWLA